MPTRRLASVLLLLCCATASQAETLRLTVTDSETGQSLENAVVELISAAAAVTPQQAVLDQIDKEFVPPVTVIPQGSRVNFPNSDDILHHVYSFSAAKTFDIPLYGQGTNSSYEEVFETAGVVEIGCNIHDWMLAYIYVAESALAGTTDATGMVDLTGLTPGSHQLKIWHPRMPGTAGLTQTIQIQTGATTELSLAVELGRDRRIRRAPSTTRNRYR
ncbi:MAG: methylamine utilization protein [Pseudohongiellaceae bacterium]